MEKRLRTSLKSSPEEFLSAVAGLNLKSSKAALKSVLLHPQHPPLASPAFSLSLHRAVSQSVASLRDLLRGSPDADPSDLASPPSKRPRRSSRCLSGPPDRGGPPPGLERRKQKLLERLRVLAHVARLCVSVDREARSAADDLLPAVRALHDNLVLFESDSVLSAEIVGLCEEWWKGDLPGRENLISQFLPFLVSRSLTLKKKVDVGRVYAMRDAFGLFDFEDDSIEDLKMLLIRCVISPLYLKTEEGKRFVAFMFGLSRQLLKDALAMIKSQIPFGRKSMLEAYGDILFRAWNAAEGGSKEEIENGFLQGLIEGAIHSSSAALATSIRRVLGGFINQRTVDGVEKVLFRLTEPVLFRSLQVANSDVRQNALHLLLDVFPLEDPDATKEVKDSLLDRQFYLLERLLKDDCPDVRVVAVEGCCRILNLFWEVIPSSTLTKIITRIFDDMAYDNCSEVRLSTIYGIAYLLGNAQSHEVLKVLLPRLGHLITDGTLSVRVALIELLLLIRDNRSFQFNKVVTLEALLSTLATDQAQVAQKITRLLLPSYFPSKVTFEEACNRCVTLIKRSPKAGARFCEYAAPEGAPLKSLMQLFKVFINFVLSTDKMNEDQIEGLLDAAAYICKQLIGEPSFKDALKDIFANDKLKCLFAAAPTAHAQSSVLNIVSAISPDDVSGLIEECGRLVMDCIGICENEERQSEVRSAHKLLLSYDRCDDMFDAFSKLLQNAAFHCHKKFGIDMSEKQSISSSKRKKNQSLVKSLAKKRRVSQQTPSSFEDGYLAAVGVAWQIRDLLGCEDSRKAMLASSSCELIFNSLKVITTASIVECVNAEYMSMYPLLAYTTLVLHMASADLILSSSQNSRNSMYSTSNPSRAVTEVMDQVLNCAEKLLRAGGPVDPASGQKEKETATDTSRPSDSGSLQSTGKRISRKVKMLTAIFKFLSDAITLRFYSGNYGRCLHYTSAAVRQIISDLAQLSSHSLQLTEDDMKEVTMCLKSSFTYMVKLLSLVLTDTSEASRVQLEIFDLANHLLDLIISVELSLGYGCAMRLIAAAKPWLPDLVVALGSTYMLNKIHEDVSLTFSDISTHFPSWPSVVARIEVDELSEDCSEVEDESISQSEKYPAFKKVLQTVLVLLKANTNLLDAVGMIFLAGSVFGLERDDDNLVLGLLHFVTAKLVGQENRHWDQLDMMLASVDQIYLPIEKKLGEQISGYRQNRLSASQALLEPVWMNHHSFESGRLSEMNEQ
ncbi:hypothetical protein BT93_H2486 [Corymbia citriodora subsp. variegata]|nr:hypothetical protein BT93_H2486 [Corymbia citriodora subsp. variegata]KAF8017314.1 hypothetical protein BT93_H2486 [Corymbia citriodora subsp. variegata]